MGPDDVTAAWNKLAPAWDRHVDYVNDLTAGATDTLVDALEVQPGERLLELAGGPGTLGARWSKLVGPGGSVLVSDVAPAMVAAAEQRLGPFENVETVRLDMGALDLPEASADVVFCRFGLMFVPQPESTLAAIFHVLAPGGRLGAMTWAELEENPWAGLIGRGALALGLLEGGPPVGPGEVFSLGDPDRLVRMAEGAGFDDVAVATAAVDFAADDVATHVERVVSLSGPLALAVQSASPAQYRTLLEMTEAAAEPFASGDGYVFPGRALLLTASRNAPGQS